MTKATTQKSGKRIRLGLCLIAVSISAFPAHAAKPASRKDTQAPAISSFVVPSPSTSLTVSGITLSATDNKGVTGYLLREISTAPLSNSAGWTSTAPTSFTFASTGVKTLYAWAKDAAGNISAAKSAYVSVSIVTPSPTPTATITPSPTPTTGSAILSWDRVTTWTDGTVLGDLTGYIIHYGTASGVYTKTALVNDPAAISFTLTGLPVGYTYYFVISAVSASGGESAYSNEASKAL